MKRVSAYQATDGEIFTDKEKCKKHQHKLDIRKGVETIVYSQTDEGCNLDSEGLVEFILEHSEVFLKALMGKEIRVVDEDYAGYEDDLVVAENSVGDERLPA